MDYYAARREHTEWLQAKLVQDEARLAEAEALVLQLQGSIAYYRQALEQLAPSSSKSQSADNSPKGEANSQEDVNDKEVSQKLYLLEGNPNQSEDDCFKEDDKKRNPKDMLLPQYKGKTLGEVIEIRLEAASGHVLGVEEITKQVFVVRSDEEFLRAKNSLSTELRRGAKEGRWQQVGRGKFRANSASSQSPQEVTINEGNGFLGNKPLPL